MVRIAITQAAFDAIAATMSRIRGSRTGPERQAPSAEDQLMVDAVDGEPPDLV
jgi:hypothetical protein